MGCLRSQSGDPAQTDRNHSAARQYRHRNTLYERSRVAGKAATMQADEKAVLLLRRKTLSGNGPDLHASERRCLSVYGVSRVHPLHEGIPFLRSPPGHPWLAGGHERLGLRGDGFRNRNGTRDMGGAVAAEGGIASTAADCDRARMTNAAGRANRDERDLLVID